MNKNRMVKAYVAGLFDGEGSVSILYSKVRGVKVVKAHPYFQWTLVVSLANTNEQIIKDLQEQFGGNIQLRQRGKSLPCWYWKISATKAENFLKFIEPYIRIKQKHTSVALAFRQLMKLQDARRVRQNGGRFGILSHIELRERAILARGLYRLNNKARRIVRRPAWSELL